MSLDIKLGCLTLHLDDNNWLKGNVDDKKSNILRFLGGEDQGETPGGSVGDNSQNQAAQLNIGEEQKRAEEQKSMGPPPINMGKRALLRIMGPSRRQVQIDHEEELKA